MTVLEGTSETTQVDLLCLDTGKPPQNERDFSAESNIIAEGQNRKERDSEDSPGGPLVKNPPANEGDVGSGPGRVRSRTPRSSYAREPQVLKPARPATQALRGEKGGTRSTHGARRPAAARRSETPRSQKGGLT